MFVLYPDGRKLVETQKWEDRTEHTLTIKKGFWPWSRRKVILHSDSEIRGYVTELSDGTAFLTMIEERASGTLIPTTEDFDLIEWFKNDIAKKDRKVEGLKKMINILFTQYGTEYAEIHKFMEEIVEHVRSYSKIAWDSLLQRDDLFKTHLGMQLDEGDLSAMKEVFAVKLTEVLDRKRITLPEPSDVMRRASRSVLESSEETPIQVEPPRPKPKALPPPPREEVASKIGESGRPSKKDKASKKTNETIPFDVTDPEQLDQFFEDMEAGKVKMFKDGEEVKVD